MNELILKKMMSGAGKIRHDKRVHNFYVEGGLLTDIYKQGFTDCLDWLMPLLLKMEGCNEPHDRRKESREKIESLVSDIKKEIGASQVIGDT